MIFDDCMTTYSIGLIMFASIKDILMDVRMCTEVKVPQRKIKITSKNHLRHEVKINKRQHKARKKERK